METVFDWLIARALATVTVPPDCVNVPVPALPTVRVVAERMPEPLIEYEPLALTPLPSVSDDVVLEPAFWV